VEFSAWENKWVFPVPDQRRFGQVCFGGGKNAQRGPTARYQSNESLTPGKWPSAVECGSPDCEHSVVWR